MSQQFCLKWNNHTTNMLQVFESLLSTEALVDVTLACDGLSLKAHKMVLSACSPFFQSLFLENPCKHPIVIMKDMRYCDLKAIIDFMYRGEVNVSHDQLSALLKTAETLKVKGLAEVTGENRHASGIVQQEITQQQQQSTVSTPTPTPLTPTAQRTDTPPLQGKRKRGRPRKRSLSDSNRSDDEGVAAKIKERDSPDVEELSGDASMDATSDIRSGGGPGSSNSQSQVHSSNNVNSFSKSHLSISQDPQVDETSGDENEFEVEPSKLLEQTLTTDNVPSSSQNSTGHIQLPSVSGLEISRRSMSSTDSLSQALVPASDSLGSNLQAPDSPQDIKPQILSFDDPPISPVAGPSHSERSMMMYMDQSGVSSIPGPSNYQDNSALVPHDSQPQEHVWNMIFRSAQLFSWGKISNHDSSDKLPELKCDRCSYVTDKIVNFQKHISIHVGDEIPACEQCGEEFNDEIELLRHLCNFSGTKTICCEFCTRKFGYLSSLKKHQRRHTMYQAHKCALCSKRFNEKNELIRHSKTHRGERNFDCDLCDKSFYEKKDLSRHSHSHSGEKPFVCVECGKKFSRKNDLVRHSRLHTGEKYFNCEYCGKEFYRKDKLKIHVRVHTGEKPFSCDKCGRKFSAKTDMSRHYRLHTGERPFSCADCGKNFSLKSKLRDHVCIKELGFEDKSMPLTIDLKS